MVKLGNWFLGILLIVILVLLFAINNKMWMILKNQAEIKNCLSDIKEKGIPPQRLFDGDYSVPDANGDRYDRAGQKYDKDGVPYGN